MKVLQLFNKMRHRFETYKAFRSPSNFEKYLRKKGCVIGKDIFWCNIKSLDIDLTRPQLIQIGDKCKINNDVTLMTHDGASNVFRHLYHDFLPSSGPIIIGENVYIGRKTTILKNVTIGNNVVLGCGEEAPNVLKPAVYAFGIATVGERSVIPDNVRIGKNTAISGITVPEDYPDGELAGGQVITAKDGDE